MELLDLGLAFDPDAAGPIDWDGPFSYVLANPEWVRREPGAADAARRRLPDLRGHVWVATSGSTSVSPGQVRWVALSRDALLASASAVNQHLAASRTDVWAHALPLFHVGGLGILARAHLSGARVVAGVTGRWDAGQFRSQVEEARATCSALVPSQVHDLVAAKLAAPASLRAVIVGGGPLAPDLYRQALGLGWPCLPSYGLTETASQVATARIPAGPSTAYPNVLPLLPHAEARCADDGRLEVRAASLLTCYADVTDDDVRSWDPKRDGWLTTDDLGVVHAAGIEVLGRAGDTVKVLGELVPLARVEAHARRWAEREPVLAGTPLDLAVVAAGHPRLGHELILVVAPAEPGAMDSADLPALLASFDAYARGQMLPFERVHRLLIAARIPRTALGKCQRLLLLREVGLQS